MSRRKKKNHAPQNSGRVDNGPYGLDAEHANMEFWEAGDPSTTGVHVNEFTALNYAAVYSAITLISDTLGIMPIEVRRVKKSGSYDIVTDHPVHDVFNVSPDGDSTAFISRQTAQGHVGLRGNCVYEVGRNGRGQGENLWLLDPRRVSYVVQDGMRRYIVHENTGPQTLDESEVFHIPAFSWNSWIGKSPITLARESIGLGIGAERYGATYFRRGGRVQGFLTKPGMMSDKQKETLRQEWNELHAGLRNALSVGILSGGLGWQSIGLSNEDAQFLETRKFQVSEVGRWYKVPPVMLGELENAKFDNIENLVLYFLTFCIIPHCVRWEQEANMKMFTRVEKSSYECRFNFLTLLRADQKTQGAVAESLAKTGVNTLDEIRSRLFGLNPYPNGIGDKPLVLGSQMATLEDVIKGRVNNTGTANPMKKDGEKDDGMPEDDPNPAKSMASIVKLFNNLNESDQDKILGIVEATRKKAG